MSQRDNHQLPKKETIQPKDRIIDAAQAFLNIDLLSDAVSEIGMVNWYRISLTTYYVGILGLLCWSLYFGAAFGLDYIISSRGYITGLSRVLSVGPSFILALWVFAGLARWIAKGIDSTHREGNSVFTPTDIVKMSVVSSLGIFLALITRSILFSMTSQVYTPPLSELQVMAFVLVDVSWISLLLIGVGGFGSILFGSGN